MKIEDFIRKFKENLEIDDDVFITRESSLLELPEYDSLGILSIIALVDEEFEVKLSNNQFKALTTIESLINTIGKEHFKE